MNTVETLPGRSYSAGLYIRLSREDELKGESNSVTSQREILREYVKQHPEIKEFDCYVDDGWTGTNFDRPAFNRMMEDIRAGFVNCVIVKDLSRFGRNYTRGGELITNEFVRLGVRFIACNNFYDSLSPASSAAMNCITLGVTNVINESVSATTSVNVRATLNINRQNGKFIGSFASYGYRKDPADKHHLLIDPVTAPVVKEIFNAYAGGKSIIAIVRELNAKGIPNPTAYKYLSGIRYKSPASSGNDGLWQDSTVRRILKNEIYTGTMVQGKSRNISYKVQRSVKVPKNEWYRVENTHEAIVGRELFDNVQSIFAENIHVQPGASEVHLFAGLVRCASCGRIMTRKVNRMSYGTYEYFRCVTNKRMDKSACSAHSIRADKLEETVLHYLQRLISEAVDMDELLRMIDASEKRKELSFGLLSSKKRKQTEREKYFRLMTGLYPDWKSGALSDEEYLTLKKEYREKTAEADAAIAELQKRIEETGKGQSATNEFIGHFRQYGNITKLSRRMLVELIDGIKVYENNKIEISVKYADHLQTAEEYIRLNKELLPESEAV